MSMIQYGFCCVYSLLGGALICVITSQKEQENSPVSVTSERSDTYYSRNMRNSAEYQKKLWTKILAFSFFAVNAAHLFYSASIG